MDGGIQRKIGFYVPFQAVDDGTGTTDPTVYPSVIYVGDGTAGSEQARADTTATEGGRHGEVVLVRDHPAGDLSGHLGDGAAVGLVAQPIGRRVEVIPGDPVQLAAGVDLEHPRVDRRLVARAEPPHLGYRRHRGPPNVADA